MPRDSALQRLAQLNSTHSAGTWFIAALEGVEASEGEYRQDPGWFHPSGLGDDCDAKLAFMFLGAPGISSISARTRRIFDLGSGRDEYLKRDTNRTGLSLIDPTRKLIVVINGNENIVEADRWIQINDLYIRGELDEWVRHPSSGNEYVIDFKTMRSGLFNELEEAKPEHVIQVHPYMFAKGTGYAFILYENKDTQEFKLKAANFNPQIWNDIVNRIRRILEGLQQNYVNRNAVNCARCPFFANAVCAANEIELLKQNSGLYPNA